MRNLYYLIICFLSFSVLSAQEKLSKEEKARREKNIQAGNPFAKYGSKAPVATLSKGKYLEVHDLDSIVTIGTIRWHVDKKEIVGKIKIDSLDIDSQPIGDAPGMWMSPDPLSEEFPSWSPYNMCMDNPVNMIDPDGRSAESIGVNKNKDGTYTVVSGNANDRDRGIYIANKDGKYTVGVSAKVGESKTTHSFFDDKNKVVAGAILDPKSTAGQKFSDGVMKDNPAVGDYMLNATKGEKYDFKTQGIENKPVGQTDLQYKYRGSVDENGDFGSARDFGNYTAGMVAAKSGFTWQQSRLALDGLETLQTAKINTIPGTKIPYPSITPTREATVTVKAQMTGFLVGLQRYQRN